MPPAGQDSDAVDRRPRLRLTPDIPARASRRIAAYSSTFDSDGMRTPRSPSTTDPRTATHQMRSFLTNIKFSAAGVRSAQASKRGQLTRPKPGAGRAGTGTHVQGRLPDAPAVCAARAQLRTRVPVVRRNGQRGSRWPCRGLAQSWASSAAVAAGAGRWHGGFRKRASG